MSVNGQPTRNSAESSKLEWTGRVLSAEDVRSRLNGQPEVVLRSNTIVTPSASDELRRRGVRITRQDRESESSPAVRWAYAQDREYPIVASVAQALKREGLGFEKVQLEGHDLACRWARALAEFVQRRRSGGALAFCQDAGMVCCVANKVAGVRAMVAGGIRQDANVLTMLGANLVCIEIAGRTFFELKQLVRAVCSTDQPACSGELARVIEELEGHAHR